MPEVDFTLGVNVVGSLDDRLRVYLVVVRGAHRQQSLTIEAFRMRVGGAAVRWRVTHASDAMRGIRKWSGEGLDEMAVGEAIGEVVAWMCGREGLARDAEPSAAS